MIAGVTNGDSKIDVAKAFHIPLTALAVHYSEERQEVVSAFEKIFLYVLRSFFNPPWKFELFHWSLQSLIIESDGILRYEFFGLLRSRMT